MTEPFDGSAIVSDVATRTPAFKNRPVYVNVVSNWLWFLIVVISGFLIPRFIDRHQGQELLGVWDLGWSLRFYVGILQFGIASAISRYVARYRVTQDWDALNASVNSSLAILLASFALGVGVSLGLAAATNSMLPGLGPDSLRIGRWVVLLIGLSTSLCLPGWAFTAVIAGYERYDILSMIRGTRDVLQLIAMITLLLCDFGLVSLAMAHLCTDVLYNLLTLVWARRLCSHLRVSPAFCKREVMREMISFGGKTAVRAAGRSGLYQLNSILVSVFLGPGTLAIYSRQRNLVMRFMQFVQHYAEVFVPTSSTFTARNDTLGLQRMLVESSKYGLYLSLPCIAFLILMGKEILGIWMGGNYEAPLVLSVFALGHLLYVSQLGTYSILMGMGRHGLPGVMELIAAVVSVLLGIVFLGPLKGNMVLAAISVAVPTAISGGIAVPWYACRLLGLKFSRYLRLSCLGPCLAAGPFIASVSLGRLLFPDEPIQQVLAGMVLGGTVLGIIYWRWVIPAQFKLKIRKALGLSKKAREDA